MLDLPLQRGEFAFCQPKNGAHARPDASVSHRMHLFISFRKSTHPQNRQLIVYCYLFEYQVADFVGELTFEN
jgi:hypothetical protein